MPSVSPPAESRCLGLHSRTDGFMASTTASTVDIAGRDSPENSRR
jgi:hypothetical protein